MKILHLSNSDLDGGGSVVAYRLHKALLKSKVESTLLVNEKKSQDDTIVNKSSSLDIVKTMLKNRLIFQFKKILKISHQGTISLNYFSSNIPKKIGQIEHDIIHLHSINKEMISLEQISKISKPLIWTFMDMWPICGIEHYSDELEYKIGYKKKKLIDLNFSTWEKKKKLKNFKIVCLSDWLSNKVKESYLFNKFDIHIIPPCIDTSVWKHIDKKLSRDLLGLKNDEKILLFSAANGTSDKRKGFDILINVLNNDTFKKNKYRLIIIGNISSDDKRKIPIPYSNYLLNTTDNELIFKVIYSAADLLVIPSRLESFGQTIIEAGSCNTASIGFNNTGVQQAIIHKKSGYLANINDKKDLFNGINWCFKEMEDKNNQIGIEARKNVEKNFSYEFISQKYINLYDDLLKNY